MIKPKLFNFLFFAASSLRAEDPDERRERFFRLGPELLLERTLRRLGGVGTARKLRDRLALERRREAEPWSATRLALPFRFLAFLAQDALREAGLKDRRVAFRRPSFASFRRAFAAFTPLAAAFASFAASFKSRVLAFPSGRGASNGRLSLRRRFPGGSKGLRHLTCRAGPGALEPESGRSPGVPTATALTPPGGWSTAAGTGRAARCAEADEECAELLSGTSSGAEDELQAELLEPIVPSASSSR